MQSIRVWSVIRIGVWVVAGLLVALVLGFAATVVALPGCSRCHNAADMTSQTQARAHAGIECIRCHAAAGVPHRITYAYNLILGQTLRVAPANGGPITAIPDGTCLSCHAEVLDKTVTADGLSILHSKCTKGRMCTDCHSDTAHGTAVKWVKTENMNQCLECHNADRVRADCDSCHAKKSEQDRIRSGEWAVTHGSNWRKTHGMGSLETCAACHPRDYCARCHGIRLPHDLNFIRSHPSQALAFRKDCAVCHGQPFCDSCHGMPMPHPDGFTPSHSKIVKQEGETKCARCHVQDDCQTCHVRHVHPGGATSAPRSGAQ